MSTAPTGLEAAAGRIRRARVIPILRLPDGDRVVEIARVLVDNGFPVIEITTDHPHAVRSIAAVREALDGAVTVGAGTVLDDETLQSVAAVGAEFFLSPHLDAALVASGSELGLLPVPGVLSPTEIVAAQRLGLGLLKLFPCGGNDPGYLKALRGPFPSVGFIPTGGIGLEGARAWLDSGAAAVGLGSALVGRGGYDQDLALRAARLRRLIDDGSGRQAGATPRGSERAPEGRGWRYPE